MNSSIHDTFQSRQPRCASRWFGLTIILIIYVPRLYAQSEAASSAKDLSTHRLLPGIVGRGIDDVNWTRTQHDALATGFSPLVCGMRRAPEAWQETTVEGGTVNLLAIVTGPKQQQCVLVDDGRLRLITAAGEVVWTRSAAGALIGSGDLRGDGGSFALFGAGPRLTLMDLTTGEELWRHLFQPAYVAVRAIVADILVDRPGLEAVVFLEHGEEACLVSFPPDAAPEIIWQRRVVEGEFNERYDHHNATIQLDLSQRQQPVVWNLRRHRCRGFDARTGERLSTITYDIGGAKRRNYGPMYLGRGRDGELLACVFGERVQVHSHAIGLHRDRNNELQWQHYYGEVYKEAPGVTLESHGLIDMEGDGATEMIYSVRDPADGFRSVVRIRAADTGEIRFELRDHWGIGAFTNIGPDLSSGFLALAAPNGQTPRRGRLKVYRFNGTATPQPIGELRSAGFWGPPSVPAEEGRELLLRELDQAGRATLSRLAIHDGELVRTAGTSAPRLLENPIHAILGDGGVGEVLCLSTGGGQLRALTWNGEEKWTEPLKGHVSSAVSAADLNGDGRAELVAATNKRLQIFSCGSDGVLTKQQDFQHQIGWHNHHPVICSLHGDARLSLLAAGTDDAGNLVIRAYRPDGGAIWETPLNVTGEDVRSLILNAGRFLTREKTGIAVSLTDSRHVHEGTFMLDGQTGRVLWFKGLYRDGPITMPYRPNGIPIAYDLDRDGVEEVGMDMLSYMAFLRGADGEFKFLRHTSNIRVDDALYAGRLYNTFCPIWKAAGDAKPHWFVTAGFGPFGLMNPDPRHGVWKEDLDYDVPTNIALVDVDGDGELEAGYAAINDATFVCRDVWTGEVEWTVDLPSAPNAATITADFDGDQRGEFFCGAYCIGVSDQGEGEIRWQSPVHFPWPVIADFDGDGLGEIAGGAGGRIVVLNASR